MPLFNSGDSFSLYDMTDAINKLPLAETRYASMFEETAIHSPDFAFELKQGHLHLVSDGERNIVPDIVNRYDPRAIKHLRTCHLAQAATVMPDDVAGQRAFGTLAFETPEQFINDKMLALKRNIELTKEAHRLGAIKGKVLDADGTTVLYDIFEIFNKTQRTKTIDFTTAAAANKNPVLTAILNIQRECEAAMEGNPYNHFECIVGSGFYDALTTHDRVREFFEHWMANQPGFGNNDRRSGFTYGGMTFVECSKVVAGRVQVASDEAYVYPVGPGIWKAWYAPADWTETVNTLGLPFYARMDENPRGRGWTIEAQSNPCFLCMYPEALCKITAA